MKNFESLLLNCPPKGLNAQLGVDGNNEQQAKENPYPETWLSNQAKKCPENNQQTKRT